MSKTEKAINQMEAWAADDSHGYDQKYRWGEKGDFDCSAAVIQAWENAGVPVKSNGASYTGNMLAVFKRCGFSDITSSINLSTGSGLKRGDVLLNVTHHTAMYCGNGYEVEASINEKGTVTGGTPGDQTGREFLKRKYRNYPWTNVLRYNVETKPETETTPDSYSLRSFTIEVQRACGANVDGIAGVETLSKTVTISAFKNSRHAVVKPVQRRLYSLGYTVVGKADGIAGPLFTEAVKEFQWDHNCVKDGEITRACKTWRKLLGM